MNKSYKFAVVSNNGETVGMHFGSSRYYEVFSVEEGKIVSVERRDKPAKKTGHKIKAVHSLGLPSDNSWTDTRNSMIFDSNSDEKHSADRIDKLEMAEPIKDCSFVISRGMGFGVYKKLEAMQIQPIITDNKFIQDAVNQMIDSTIKNYPERMH